MYNVEKKSPRGVRTVVIEFSVCLVTFIAYVSTALGLVFQPTITYFTCDRSDILAPYLSNSVPTIHLIALGNIVPLVAILAIEIVNSKNNRRGRLLHDISYAFNLFWLGESIVGFITEVIKRSTGQLRPNFLDVCRPNLESIVCFNRTADDAQLYNWIFTGGDFCTGDPNKVEEARLSKSLNSTRIDFQTTRNSKQSLGWL